MRTYCPLSVGLFYFAHPSWVLHVCKDKKLLSDAVVSDTERAEKQPACSSTHHSQKAHELFAADISMWRTLQSLNSAVWCCKSEYRSDIYLSQRHHFLLPFIVIISSWRSIRNYEYIVSVDELKMLLKLYNLSFLLWMFKQKKITNFLRNLKVSKKSCFFS